MNSSLAAVAGRIQERNNALRSELASLELLEIQHLQARERLRADELASAEARKKLLVAVRARHERELESLRLDDEIRRIDEDVTRLRRDAEAARARTNDLGRRFDEEHAPIYAAHDVSTRLHSMRSEARLVAAGRRKRRREERLRDLRERTERNRAEAAEMRSEAERVRAECAAMDRGEDEDDEETVALNMQIKSALAQKASLRKSLNEAREMQQTASTNRDTWERRVVEGK